LLRGDSSSQPIIDSHVHLFLPEFAYHPNASYRPEAHPLADYLAFLKQAPVRGAVVVHPEPYQDDHRILDFIFAREPSPRFFKATCLFDPIDPATPGRMEALSRKHPGRIVGIRIHEVHKPGTPPSTGGPIKDRDFADPGMKNVFRAARRLKIAVQFHLIPYYAPRVRDLASEFADVPIVLDHLARAHEGTPEEAAQALALGKLPNVFIKYSGSYAGDAALARRAYDAFGSDRVICGYIGMDLAAYRKWSADFDSAFGSLPAADQAKIRLTNARKLYNFE
jgi:predicted TIM-barrel fold metal-dependent hydrolase